MKRLSLVICALAVAVPAFAQDATGKWHLTVTTPEREPRTATMVLKKEGDKLTGTVGETGLKGRATIGGTEVGTFTGKKQESGAN